MRTREGVSKARTLEAWSSRTSFRCTMADLFQPATKPGFHRVELLRAVWEVPLYYQDLQPIGTGAYGSVMLVVRRMGELRGRASVCGGSDLRVSVIWILDVPVYKVVIEALN